MPVEAAQYVRACVCACLCVSIRVMQMMSFQVRGWVACCASTGGVSPGSSLVELLFVCVHGSYAR